MKPLGIKYLFRLPDSYVEVFDLWFDRQTMALLNIPSAAPPEWTKLEYHQCANCFLSSQTHPYCPLALNMVPILRKFKDLASYNQLYVEITTEERLISQTTSAQTAISSLMGLIIATCGCPHTAFFRPMARFHLPLANEDETIYRAAAMYLLAQYFKRAEGGPVDLTLSGLAEIYTNVGIVNRAIADRIRGAEKKDSAINALVLLDVFTMALPFAIEDSLKELRPLFNAYLPPAAP